MSGDTCGALSTEPSTVFAGVPEPLERRIAAAAVMGLSADGQFWRDSYGRRLHLKVQTRTHERQGDSTRGILTPMLLESGTSIDEPLRTLTTAGHQSVVTFLPGRSPKKMLESARMRFLTVNEMAAGMGFPPGYRLSGNRDEQRTMLGNAVTPPAARDLIAMVREAIVT